MRATCKALPFRCPFTAFSPSFTACQRGSGGAPASAFVCLDAGWRGCLRIRSNTCSSTLGHGIVHPGGGRRYVSDAECYDDDKYPDDSKHAPCAHTDGGVRAHMASLQASFKHPLTLLLTHSSATPEVPKILERSWTWIHHVDPDCLIA